MARRQHAEFFLALAEEATAGPTGTRLARLRIEHDNLRSAMTWFAAQPDGAGELRLAAALSRYCHPHGHYREGRRWLDQALARAGDEAREPLARALAAAHATTGLRICETLGDHQQTGRLRRLLGSMARERARYPEALHSYASAEQSFRTAGDPFGVACSQQLAGATAWLSGDLDLAGAKLTASLTRPRDLDDALDTFGELEFKEGMAWALNLLGLLEHRDGQHERAAPLLQTSLALHRELGDRWREASVLEALAGVACATIPKIERPALAQIHAAVGTGPIGSQRTARG